MNKKKLFALTISGAILISSVTGCTSKTTSSQQSDDKKGPSGTITVLTQRTDIVDSVFKAKYVPEFQKKYPNVNVKFEAITDYEAQVKTRLNTKDYGDVLLIPNVSKDQLSNFFEPLGNLDEMSKTYNYLNDKSYEGKAYGIPIVANTQGILINKKVWDAAGATTNPKSTDELLADLKKIKDKGGVDAPLYTNFAAKWTLTQWDADGLSITGDADWKNKMTEDDAPFSAGKAYYETWNVLYQAVKNKLVEADPVTTDWEKSKQMLADGKIAAMTLGSWSIQQVKALSKTPDDIVYMPFPAAPNGKQYAAVGGDYNIAINKNSKNKAAARAWLDWFINDSSYSDDNFGISALKSKALPTVLQAYQAAGVTFVQENPAPAGKEALWDNINKESAIGLNTEQPGMRIEQAALTGKEDFATIMADFNKKWKDARTKAK